MGNGASVQLSPSCGECFGPSISLPEAASGENRPSHVSSSDSVPSSGSEWLVAIDVANLSVIQE